MKIILTPPVISLLVTCLKASVSRQRKEPTGTSKGK